MTAKYAVATTGVATATKAKAAPKKEAHLMTPAEIAAALKVYFNKPSKTTPVPTMQFNIGGRIVPFACFLENGVATNRTAEIPANFEDTEENRAELVAAYAEHYLSNPVWQEQVTAHLTTRFYRLQDEKKAKADAQLATKLAKVNLAVKAETAIAAKVLGEAALED